MSISIKLDKKMEKETYGNEIEESFEYVYLIHPAEYEAKNIPVYTFAKQGNLDRHLRRNVCQKKALNNESKEIKLLRKEFEDFKKNEIKRKEKEIEEFKIKFQRDIEKKLLEKIKSELGNTQNTQNT